MSEEIQKPRKTMMETAAGAVNFKRILIVGLLALLAMIVALSFTLSYAPPQETKGIEFTLAYFKDLALMMAGGLISSLSGHQENKPDA